MATRCPVCSAPDPRPQYDVRTDATYVECHECNARSPSVPGYGEQAVARAMKEWRPSARTLMRQAN